MAIYLTEDEVLRFLTMEDALRVVEEAFQQQGLGVAVNEPRRRVRTDKGLLHLMGGALPHLNRWGYKAYTTTRHGARFWVHLFDLESGELLAVLAGDHLGRIRTGAASGVATQYMAKPDARSLAVFGTGRQAPTQIEAVCSVRPIAEVRICSRNEQHRTAFAQEMGTKLVNVEVRAVSTPQAALEGADVVVTITSASEPVFDGALLAPGMHINAAGVNAITKREIDATTVKRASLIAVDDRAQAQIECGDLASVVEVGDLRWEDVIELGQIVAGKVAGRTGEDAITLFESQGLAIEDVAAASLVYERAMAEDVGQELPL